MADTDKEKIKKLIAKNKKINELYIEIKRNLDAELAKSSEKKTGLELLREPFEPNQIGKLPKGTKEQNNCHTSQKIHCEECKQWHHPDVIHLEYVGHAAATDRFLNVDQKWSWEPVAVDEVGLPVYDQIGGLWINLTILGVTRLGYGNAHNSQYKDIGAREKEVIGDALRNAAMRFGVALDLWHKGDLHVTHEKPEEPQKQTYLLDDNAKKWIELVLADCDVLDQIDDPGFKEFIRIKAELPE